eukprot:TRINITY_DN51973_c0_g1_i1.p1 TRINITY_DN51973_c0_g1~~TRINITY_DN51973_c0_g1_i1.p1  ORF type:complete len:432 (-),score=78.83 TRINITY_DN51973_c0_g1_i1:72-1310(-)
MLKVCQDTEDSISLEELCTLLPEELVFLELPAEQRSRYRCLARASIREYAKSSVQRFGLTDETGSTGRVVVPTYLPGVDLDYKDMLFLIRYLERTPVPGKPFVLHVESITEAPASRVLGYHETSVHLYELAEAKWERDLWALLDEAVAPATTHCPAGHVLQVHEPLPGMHSMSVVCDRCERAVLSKERYRCVQNCDFDLCKTCFGGDGGSSGSRPASRAALLDEQLEAFWREHPEFQLPPCPPLLSMQERQLCSAVTKWNGFSLDTKEMLRIRHVFLSSVERRDPDYAAELRGHLWPGCFPIVLRAESVAQRLLQKSTKRPRREDAAGTLCQELAEDLCGESNEDLGVLVDLALRALEGGVPLSIRWSIQRPRLPLAFRAARYVARFLARLPCKFLLIAGIARIAVLMISRR